MYRVMKLVLMVTNVTHHYHDAHEVTNDMMHDISGGRDLLRALQSRPNVTSLDIRKNAIADDVLLTYLLYLYFANLLGDHHMGGVNRCHVKSNHY
jgi:hypothetical protein